MVLAGTCLHAVCSGLVLPLLLPRCLARSLMLVLLETCFLCLHLSSARPLQEMDGRRILIFCETKRGCDNVTRQLRQDGWPALSIHGDKSQHERDWVLAEFKAGKHPIMIATDVAARGLGTPLWTARRRHCSPAVAPFLPRMRACISPASRMRMPACACCPACLRVRFCIRARACIAPPGLCMPCRGAARCGGRPAAGMGRHVSPPGAVSSARVLALCVVLKGHHARVRHPAAPLRLPWPRPAAIPPPRCAVVCRDA